MNDGIRGPAGRRVVRHLTLAFVAIGVAVFLLTRFVAVSWAVEGSSMEPTLQPGDRVVVDLWSYRRRAPRIGEVALLYGPDGWPLVKRVAAPVAGDRFEVLGDRADHSRDSRAFGPVPRDRFVGQVAWRYWPPSRFGPIR